jgi:putative membrane protein
MSEEPYQTYIQDHKGMILRDYLAIDRTLLANETSFMSYVRTALTLIAAGATLIKFFDSEFMQVLGWMFVVVGGWLSIHGYNRYRHVDHMMHEVKGDSPEKPSGIQNIEELHQKWPAKVLRRDS